MKITVITNFDEISREKLVKTAPEADIVWAFDQNSSYLVREPLDLPKYKDDLVTSDVVIGAPPVSLLPEMKKLKLLSLSMAGTEPYSLPGVLSKDVALCNSTGAFGKAISEHMLASIMMLIKKLHLYRDDMPSGLWADRGSVRSLSDMTVLCVGLGDIGCAFAKLCKRMGAKVIGVRRHGTTKPDYVDEVVLSDKLDEVLPLADVVALSVPGNKETAGLFSKERLARMKKDSYILNVGRGSAIDSTALFDALESGHLAGAAIDVTDPEPLPADHVLWQAKNCLITPHVSGFYHLRETYDRIVDIACENLRRFMNDEPLLTPVDRNTGYRVTQKY